MAHREVFIGAPIVGRLQRIWLILVAGAMLLGLQPAITYAHQSPGSCNSNRFNISIIKDKTEISQGDTLTYTITATNVNFGADIACDITDAVISIRLPAADGTPTGTLVTLVTNANFPAGTSTAVIGSASYVVAVNSGVQDVVAEGRAEGTLHDAPVDHSALIVKTIGTTVVAPPTSGGGGGGTPVSTPRLPNTGTAPAIL